MGTKIWTENRGFVRADSLTVGDKLLWLKKYSLMGTLIEDTQIVRRNTVAIPVLSVTDMGNRCAVYDITVEGSHEFFVNGVLVHNCIDALRYMVSRKNTVMKRGGVRM